MNKISFFYFPTHLILYMCPATVSQSFTSRRTHPVRFKCYRKKVIRVGHSYYGHCREICFQGEKTKINETQKIGSMPDIVCLHDYHDFQSGDQRHTLLLTFRLPTNSMNLTRSPELGLVPFTAFGMPFCCGCCCCSADMLTVVIDLTM